MEDNRNKFWEKKVPFTPYKRKELLGLIVGLIIGAIIVIVFKKIVH